jgi:hypothetical protein
MTPRGFLAAVALTASTALPVPALAQAAAFDVGQLAAACGAGSCASAVATILAQLKLRLTPAQLNEQLAIIANIAIQAAKDNPGAAADIAVALNRIAAESTDPGQIAAIQQVAQLVASGGAAGVDIGTPVAGSAT